MDKTELRKQMLQLRSQLKPKFMENSAKRMGGQAAALPAFQSAKTVMLYHSFGFEAGTLPLIDYCLKTGKTVVLPRTDNQFVIHPHAITSPDQLRPGFKDIPEPDPALCPETDPSEIDFILVPGVAFSISGSRLGYGKGCYDRFLPLLRNDVPIVGLAYDFQVLPRLPRESTDVKMDLIVTEKGVLGL